MQKWEDEAKKKSGAGKAQATNEVSGSLKGPAVATTPPPPNAVASNPHSVASATTSLLQPSPFDPNAVMYGALAMAQASSTVVNPFYGLNPFAFQAGHGLPPPAFPQATSHYNLPALISQAPYMHAPTPNNQYLRPYNNVQLPTYPPVEQGGVYSIYYKVLYSLPEGGLGM